MKGMEKRLSSYEVLFTVNANLAEDELRACVDKFCALIKENASDVTVNEWGKRRLAYPIRYQNDGYMVLVSFTSETSFPRELERQMRIQDSILRVMITKKPASVEAAPVAVEPVAEAAPAEPAVETEAPVAEATVEAPAQTPADAE